MSLLCKVCEAEFSTYAALAGHLGGAHPGQNRPAESPVPAPSAAIQPLHPLPVYQYGIAPDGYPWPMWIIFPPLVKISGRWEIDRKRVPDSDADAHDSSGKICTMWQRAVDSRNRIEQQISFKGVL